MSLVTDFSPRTTRSHQLTGLMPQDVLDEENEYFKRALANDDNLAMLWRISENGMKQYRRTRSEASKEGVKMTKALVKGNVIRSLHPLIVGCDPTRCSPGVVEKQEFVRMLQKFRPAQTVFESGIGLGTGACMRPYSILCIYVFSAIFLTYLMFSGCCVSQAVKRSKQKRSQARKNTTV